MAELATEESQGQPKLHEILRSLMKEINVTEAELARKTNIPQPTLHRILSGETKSPRGSSLSPLANYLSVSINQLLGDEPLPPRGADGKTTRIVMSQVPVISWQDAANWQNAKREKSWDQWLSTDMEISSEAFALTLTGDRSVTNFIEGTVLIIEPNHSAKAGDFAIVTEGDRQTIGFKQLTAGFNPHTIVGTVIQARTNFMPIENR